MIDPAALLKLTTLGLSAEQYAGVLEVLAAAVTHNASVTPELSANALRQKRYRERSKALRVTDRNAVETSPAVTSEVRPASPPSPFPKENNPSPLPPHHPIFSDAGDAFEDFWAIYPNKVGKADARKKFPIALRKVKFDVLLDALRRYAGKTDDRPWLNPATWLHQERWADQPAQVSRGSPGGQPLRGVAALTAQLQREILEDEQSGNAGAARGDPPATLGLFGDS